MLEWSNEEKATPVKDCIAYGTDEKNCAGNHDLSEYTLVVIMGLLEIIFSNRYWNDFHSDLNIRNRIFRKSSFSNVVEFERSKRPPFSNILGFEFSFESTAIVMMTEKPENLSNTSVNLYMEPTSRAEPCCKRQTRWHFWSIKSRCLFAMLLTQTVS